MGRSRTPTQTTAANRSRPSRSTVRETAAAPKRPGWWGGPIPSRVQGLCRRLIPMVDEWLEPIGTYLTREERATRYRGAKFGGIEPSRKTPNVFLYSDPAEGEAFGYNFDGWNEDESVFLYRGRPGW